MNKLSRLDIQKLEDYWINFSQYKTQLKFREWELLNQYVETDTNQGGGKGNGISNPTERKALVLAEDMLYQNLKRIVGAIDNIYSSLEGDKKTIVDMRYWDAAGCYEWEDIAEELDISRNKVLRKRNLLIDKTAERLGWL